MSNQDPPRADEHSSAPVPAEESRSSSWAALVVIGVVMLLIGAVEWWFQRP